MAALLIDTTYLSWILVFAFVPFILVLLVYVRSLKAQLGRALSAQGEKTRAAGEIPMTYVSKDAKREKLAAVTRPFRALFDFVAASDGRPVGEREGLIRVLEALTEKAKDAIKDKEGISSHHEALHLAALTSALENYKEIISTSSDEELSGLQHPLRDFVGAIEKRTREQFGIQQHTPELVRSLIAFGDSLPHQLDQAKKYIAVGELAYDSYLKVVSAENTERPNDMEILDRFFTDLPVRLRESAATIRELEGNLSAAEKALEDEKNKWSGFADEKLGLEGQINTLQSAVAEREADIKARDAQIVGLDSQIVSLGQEKQELTTQLEGAQSILKRLIGIGRLAERLTEGRQALDHRLSETRYRVHFAFLMYYSLFTLCASIVGKDKQKERLMLVNLYRMTTRCKRYQDFDIRPFDMASTEISEELASLHQVADVKQLKDELARQANFVDHPDKNLFSVALTELRESCDISLAPFFMDAETGKLMAAN